MEGGAQRYIFVHLATSGAQKRARLTGPFRARGSVHRRGHRHMHRRLHAGSKAAHAPRLGCHGTCQMPRQCRTPGPGRAMGHAFCSSTGEAGRGAPRTLQRHGRSQLLCAAVAAAAAAMCSHLLFTPTFTPCTVNLFTTERPQPSPSTYERLLPLRRLHASGRLAVSSRAGGCGADVPAV